MTLVVVVVAPFFGGATAGTFLLAMRQLREFLTCGYLGGYARRRMLVDVVVVVVVFVGIISTLSLSPPPVCSPPSIS